MNGLKKTWEEAMKVEDEYDRKLRETKYDLTIDVANALQIVIDTIACDAPNEAFALIMSRMDILNNEDKHYKDRKFEKFHSAKSSKISRCIIWGLEEAVKEWGDDDSDDEAEVTKWTPKHPQYYLDMRNQFMEEDEED